MWRDKFNVLVLESDAEVFETIQHAVMGRRVAAKESPRFTVEHATTVEAALERLRAIRVDAILIGIHRRDSSGLHWITRLNESSPLIPIVAILDTSDERLAVAAASVGAIECLSSEQTELLPQALRYLIGERAAEMSLAQSEENFRVLIEHSSDVTTLLNAELTICYISPAAEPILGHAPGQLRGQPFRDFVHPDDRAFVEEALTNALETPRHPVQIVVRIRHREERWVNLEIVIRNVPNRQGQPRLVLNGRDVTSRCELEAQLRQIQKIDSVGQLTAGLAHDFNNMLMVIQGHADQLLRQNQTSPGIAESAGRILDASRRAANLTRQMLAFSRRHSICLEPVDLNRIVHDFAGILRGIFSDTIVLRCALADQPAFVRADAGMIEQVLMNLAVNARDAMPLGGELRFELAQVESEVKAIDSPAAGNGPFLVLTVSDTGSGIDPEILPRIFEPFFTTKERDRGTGLGLATVKSIVKQHNGWIEVESHLNLGTVFRIFLPACNPSSGEREIYAPTIMAHGARVPLVSLERIEPAREMGDPKCEIR